MKTSLCLASLLTFAAGVTSLHAQSGVLDLTKLQNYANQTIPPYILRNNTPANNQITDIRATLGRVLFYDKRLSRNNTISCASCHKQEHAFSDGATASTGVAGTTDRHAMRLVNERFGTEAKFFWDERAATLEAQTSQPIQNHVEMGFSGTSGDPAFADLVTKLSAINEYKVLFRSAFGTTTITETLVQRALAQFVRSIQSFDSRYDAGRAVANDNQNFPNFTAQENAGKQLFLAGPGQGGAGCAGCHRPPEFDIDPNSRNNGVISAIAGGTDLTNTRSPSLRDLVRTDGGSNGGFMHNGIFTTLDQVINHYNNIPADNANLDPRLRRPGGNVQNLNLTQAERDSLVAFLRTLSGTNVYTDPKWSNPFNANNELSLIILPAATTTIQDNGNGTATVACIGATGLVYQLEGSNDLQNWSVVGNVSPNAAGVLQQTINGTTAKFYRFSYTP